MLSFTSLFPDSMECYFVLFQDAVYEHDNECNYSFKDRRETTADIACL
jgi:hypothetical protein